MAIDMAKGNVCIHPGKWRRATGLMGNLFVKVESGAVEWVREGGTVCTIFEIVSEVRMVFNFI